MRPVRRPPATGARSTTRWFAASVTVAGLVSAAPSAVSLGAVRAALTPRVVDPALSGMSTRPHVALTFDDGPDPCSTPAFLALLDRLGVRATFFVLGRHLGDRGLLRETAAAGHEVGVHGWDHRPAVLHSSRELYDGVVRTRDQIEDVTGRPVGWYRPPYGWVTWSTRRVARAAGLRTVLWTAWGRDWERGATAALIADRVSSRVRPGGTVLLHDSDRTSAPGSWRRTLAATEELVRAWQSAGLGVGPLAEHGLTAGPSTGRVRAQGQTSTSRRAK